MQGNLAMFVKRVPRAKTYYELSEENLSFTFPEPGLLDGVKSKGKAIIKMDKCTYQYPTKDVPTVFDITLQVLLIYIELEIHLMRVCVYVYIFLSVNIEQTKPNTALRTCRLCLPSQSRSVCYVLIYL